MKYPAWLHYEIHLFLSVGLGVFILFELAIRGSIFSLFNLNYWLILWIISAILIVFYPPKNHTWKE